MFQYVPYINTCGGEKYDRVKVQEKKQENGVTAVYVDAFSRADIGKDIRGALDPDNGVCIEVSCGAKIQGYMANYRTGEFWCAPYFGSDMTEMPDETQMLIVKLENGEFCAVVPVVNDTYKAVAAGMAPETFRIRMYSWYDKLYTCRGLSFVYAVGKNPAQLVEDCVKTALRLMNSQTRHRTERRYPEIFEYLGWCSWDSMQIRVSEEGLLEKCEEFKEKNIPVKWAILDDMWAEIRDFYGQEYTERGDMFSIMHSSALWHFEADPYRFPEGLAHCIDKMKEYGIHVGMWQPTTGYWRGIDPDGEAYRILKDYLIQTPAGYYIPDWKKVNSYQYYSAFHDFFRKCGAEFIKIDNQTMTNRYYKGLAPVGQIASEFHAGMEASVGEHFDNNMINCMGMGSEDMWSRSVSPISRCSDDFQPENRAWFTKHILQCAYNSIMQGQFYWCDWDMWWTDDGQAKKNSLIRAISGGPIYVSDMIGRSHRHVLAPLALDDGKILRCDKPCIPTADCIVTDPVSSKKALKLQNTVGAHGILAVLNLDKDNESVTAVIGSSDIDGLADGEYAVYEHFSRELKMLKAGETFEVELADSDDYRLYIFAPVKDGFAAIGRVDKFISPAAIAWVSDQKIGLLEDGPCAVVLNGELVISE